MTDATARSKAVWFSVWCFGWEGLHMGMLLCGQPAAAHMTISR